ncbi:hypothetical protein [Candidatus Contubernalis alkaliaceticus]|uniref:hypothetical protein n=1 Tax=Candidatus Contubernalis alkaliaceticus TaxID=338645 RepID=UPI001F4BE3CE|nr:hypothetical protein [Candidatus Contubernalis alkalaceticus]UNC91186.1 hypothetical protein HUE98_03240 [Candidatus Contubernalis alkalaceticus]
MTMILSMVNGAQPVYAQGQVSNIIFAPESNMTFYITKDNSLWGYGQNYFGQIGTGSKDFIAQWVKPYIGYVFNVRVTAGIGNDRYGTKREHQRQQDYMTT